MKSFYYCVAISTILYVSLSILLYCHATRHFDNDSYGYDRIAHHFATHNQLIDPLRPQSAPIQPVGYPFFVGLLYKICGHSIASVVGTQIILGIICIFLIGLIALRLFGDFVASIALCVSAVSVGLLTYPQLILAEMLVLVWILLFWYFFIECFDYLEKWRNYFLAGFCIGISVLIKSTALLCIPVAAICLLFWSGQKGVNSFAVNLSNYTDVCILAQARDKQNNFFIKKLKNVFLFLISAYTPILLYMTYNYLQWGYYALAPLTSLNLYQVFLSKVIAKITGISAQEVITTQLQFTGTHNFDESGWNSARTLFFSYITHHPGTCILVWLQNVGKSILGLFSTQLKMMLEPLLGSGECSFFNMKGVYWERIITYVQYGTDSFLLHLVAWLELVWLLLRWFMIWIGIIVLCQKKRYGVAVFLCFYCMQCLLITGFDGCARYRLMIEPFMLICSAAGIYWAYKKVKRIGYEAKSIITDGIFVVGE